MHNEMQLESLLHKEKAIHLLNEFSSND